MSESLAAAHGEQRGSELLATTLDRVFGAIGEAVHAHGGSVVSFAGDALACWFEGDAADHAVAAALEMQQLVASSGVVQIPGGDDIALGLKVGVAAGECTRVLVGDPDVRQFDVASGDAIDRCAEAEKVAVKGEVVVDERVEAALAGRLRSVEHRDGHAVATGLDRAPDRAPWPPLADADLPDGAFERWVQATVFERLTASDEPLLAEFRPVAPMFLGVDGIDHDRPEDVAELDRVVRETQAAVARHGGALLSVLAGDKGTYLVMSFGAPVTHGDDRRRAVAATQELQARFGDRVRIGVSAGRVFAGLFRGTVFSTYSFIGEVANTAARLMSAAQPGQALVAATVARDLDRRFRLDPLEPLRLKGIDGPVAVSELLPAGATSQAFSELRYELPLVGREREQLTIEAALEGARSGRGGFLSIVADPGMGKSRLLTAAIGDSLRRGFEVLAGECQPHGIASPYLPWQPIVHGLLGVPLGAPDGERIEALHAALRAGAPQAVPLAPLLGEALGLELPDTDITREMPAPVRRQVRHDVLAGVLMARAAAGPLCIVLDDLHWIDSSSADLLHDLTPTLAQLPVLVLAALRPLELGDRIELPAGDVVELAELLPEAAERLAVQLLAHLSGAPADPAQVGAVLERAGGNPFFVEELAREVSSGHATELPTSLEGLILHRIDQLAERQQRTVRMASIIGRRFQTDVLRGAYTDVLEQGELRDDLGGLADHGLVLLDTPEPDEAYLFRHALVRDVAYETLSFGLRERLHEQVARFLEEAVESPPVELLAFHYARTTNTDKEARYRRLAAERAIRAGAFVDAREHLDRAIEIITAREQTPAALADELQVQLLRGTTLQMLHGQSSPVAKVAYDRARELTRLLPPGPDTGRAVFGLWAYYLFQGQMGPAAELADEAVELTRHAPDPTLQVMAQLTVSQTHFWTGEFDKHEAATAAVYAGYDPELHETYVTQYTQNPRFTAASGNITAVWQLGRLDDALVELERARADAHALQHPFSLALVELNPSVLAYCRGLGHEDVQEAAERLLGVAGPIGNPVYVAWAQTNLGYAAVLRGEYDAGIAEIQQQLEVTTGMGAHMFDPVVASLLADSMRRAGRFDDGLAVLDEMTPAFAGGGRVTWACEHAKLRAELLLGRDPAATTEALALLDEAVAIARSHGTVGSELRAALIRAELLRQLGRDDWCDDLADALDRLPQGHDDPVPTAARTLLADGHHRPTAQPTTDP
ncbi:MAG: AAA family ATPase [Ilumatobacter sp.]|nr:AAA family ATPase [Ilumatobacter sp.]